MPMKADAEAASIASGAPFLRLVDEVTDDQRQGKLEPQAGEQQDAQRHHERQLWHYVAAKQVAVLPRLDRDGRLPKRDGKAHDGPAVGGCTMP